MNNFAAASFFGRSCLPANINETINKVAALVRDKWYRMADASSIGLDEFYDTAGSDTNQIRQFTRHEMLDVPDGTYSLYASKDRHEQVFARLPSLPRA